MKSNTTQFLFLTFIIISIAATRLLPHTANFVPVFAMILFATAHLKNKWNAIFISIGALWLSDLYINNWGSAAKFFDQYDPATGQLLVDNFIFIYNPLNYLGYIMIAFIGIQIFKKSISLPKVFGSSLLAAFVFFLVSNSYEERLAKTESFGYPYNSQLIIPSFPQRFKRVIFRLTHGFIGVIMKRVIKNKKI